MNISLMVQAGIMYFLCLMPSGLPFELMNDVSAVRPRLTFANVSDIQILNDSHTSELFIAFLLFRAISKARLQAFV